MQRIANIRKTIFKKLHRQLSRIHSWNVDDFREAGFLGVPAEQGSVLNACSLPGVADILKIGHLLLKKLVLPSKSEGYHKNGFD